MSNLRATVRPALAVWLDRPFSRLWERRALLGPTATVAIAAQVLMAAVGLSLQALIPSDPTALSSTSGLTAAFGSMGIAYTLLIAFFYIGQTAMMAGLEAAGRGVRLSVGELLGVALSWSMLSASLAAFATTAGSTAFTCGFGFLITFPLLVLVKPVVLREDCRGFSAVGRAAGLLLRSGPGLPKLGHLDRSIIALHVIVGVAYAFNGLVQVPNMAWGAVTGWRMVAEGILLADPTSLQAAMTPPIWLSAPTALAGAFMSCITGGYSAQLFLDLHEDALSAEQGSDILSAIDGLRSPSA